MRKSCIITGYLLVRGICFAQNTNYDCSTQVAFPADFEIGDYIEFVETLPANTGAAGNYEVPISYTRTNFAAAATHLASIHSRESRYMERSEELTLYLLEKEAQIKHLEARVTKLEEN